MLNKLSLFKKRPVETNGQEGEVFAVEALNLTKMFQRRWIAVNSINFRIPQGSIFGLVGPNGAGKSTTLRLIMGLQHPTAGEVKVFGQRMNMYTGHLRRRIGYLPQGEHYPREMTPIAYLELVGKLRGVPRKECARRLSSLLHAVDLLGAASTRIGKLSAGMTTRMAIAASMVNDPDLLMWDEPTAGLDPTGRKYTLDLIKELKTQGKTMIVSTHLLPDADQVCDQIGVLNEGKLVLDDLLSALTGSDKYTLDIKIKGDGDRFMSVLQKQGFNVTREENLFKVERKGDTLDIIIRLCAENDIQLRYANQSFRSLEDIFIDIISASSGERDGKGQKISSPGAGGGSGAN